MLMEIRDRRFAKLRKIFSLVSVMVKAELAFWRWEVRNKALVDVSKTLAYNGIRNQRLCKDARRSFC